MVTSIAVTHLAFLKPSLVAVRKRRGNPNGSVIGSWRIWSPGRLRMQRGGHVEALGVVVGAAKRDVARIEVGPDAFEKLPEFTPDHCPISSQPSTQMCLMIIS